MVHRVVEQWLGDTLVSAVVDMMMAENVKVELVRAEVVRAQIVKTQTVKVEVVILGY